MSSKNKLATQNLLLCFLGILLFSYQALLFAENRMVSHFEPGPELSAFMEQFHYVAYILALLVGGLMSDFFKLSYMLIGAFIIALLANSLYVYADSPIMFLLGNVLPGISQSLLMIGCLKIGSLHSPKKYFLLYVGLMFGLAELIRQLTSVFRLFSSESLSLDNYQTLQVVTLVMGIVVLFFSARVLFNEKNQTEEAYPTLSYVLKPILNPKIWLAILLVYIGTLGEDINYLRIQFNLFNGLPLSLFLVACCWWTRMMLLSRINDYTNPRAIGFVYGVVFTVLVFMQSLLTPLSHIWTMGLDFTGYGPTLRATLMLLLIIGSVFYLVLKPNKEESLDVAILPDVSLTVSEVVSEKKVRPWVRFWARSLDYYIWATLFALILFVSPLANVIVKVTPMQILFIELVVWLITVLSWMILEGLFLSVFATTPGKWIFNIKILSSSNEKLPVFASLNRSFKVWYKGVAMGLPLVFLFPSITAYCTLSEKKITSWDETDNIQVIHGNIGYFRLGLAVLICMLIMLLRNKFQ